MQMEVRLEKNATDFPAWPAVATKVVLGALASSPNAIYFLFLAA
jgi:hypothetical protein